MYFFVYSEHRIIIFKGKYPIFDSDSFKIDTKNKKMRLRLVKIMTINELNIEPNII